MRLHSLIIAITPSWTGSHQPPISSTAAGAHPLERLVDRALRPDGVDDEVVVALDRQPATQSVGGRSLVRVTGGHVDAVPSQRAPSTAPSPIEPAPTTSTRIPGSTTTRWSRS
jgi:hypothetical protein